MQLIFYYVVGQRANATKLNKLKDRCKIKKKTGDKMSSSTRGFELRVLSGLSSSQPPRYTTVPFSFMPRLKSILKLLILRGEDYIHLLIAFFFSEQLLSLYKRMLSDFHLLENNNNSLEVNATHILLCGGSKGQCNHCKQVNRPL